MKRAEKHLRYSATNRRPQLDEARYGSLIKLLILVGSLALAAAAAVFFIVPLLRSLPLQKEEPVPDSSEQVPVWSEKIRTLLETGWIGEVSEWNGSLLYASGPSAESLSRLNRLNLDSGESESVSVALSGDSIRYPYENEKWILYGDYSSDGSGAIRLLEKESGEDSTLYTFQEGAPPLFCSFPYVVFTARTDAESYTLTILDVRNHSSVAAARFSGPEYGASAPAIRKDQIVYANLNPEDPKSSVLHRISLADGSRSDLAPGTFIHDPVLSENSVLAISGLHSSDSVLYEIRADGSCEPIAHSVVRFGFSGNSPVFSANGTIFRVENDSGRTVALSETGAVCELVGTTDSSVIWMDRSDPEQIVFRYLTLD
jgi:hypothetical protein